MEQLDFVDNNGLLLTMVKAIALSTFAGRRYYPVEVVGETPARLLVKITSQGGVMLPGRRYVAEAEVVLVPKHAVMNMPEGKHESGYYDGFIYGYDGTVDRIGVGVLQADSNDSPSISLPEQGDDDCYF